MRIRRPWFFRSDSGQALIETALVLPLLMTVILNTVNMGYFFLVALNVVVSPRSGAQYAIMGYSTPSSLATVPNAVEVGSIAYQDMQGALASYASADVQTCTKKLGYTGSGASQKAACGLCTDSSDTACTTAAVYTPLADPEAPLFVLHRVDVKYTFTPLVTGSAFNLALLPVSLCSGGTCTFHRQVSMRAMD